MFRKVDSKEIAESLQYKDWTEIKREILIRSGGTLITEEERALWKVLPRKKTRDVPVNWHTDNLKHASAFSIRKTSQVLQAEFTGVEWQKGKLYLCFTDGSQLYSERVDAHYECPDCSQVYRFSCSRVSFKRDTSICRSCQQQILFRTDSYKKHYEDNMLAKYGARRPLQVQGIWATRRATMLNRYGVEFSVHNPDSLAKRDQTMLERYGRTNYWSGINPWKEFNQYGNQTSGNVVSHKERNFAETLQREVFSAFETRSCLNRQKRWKRHTRHTSDQSVYGFLDFYVPELKLAVEFHGDFFHLNPSIYPPDYISPFKVTAAQKWEWDKIREDDAKDVLGCDVFIVWELEWKERREEVLCRLQQLRDSKVNQ